MYIYRALTCWSRALEKVIFMTQVKWKVPQPEIGTYNHFNLRADSLIAEAQETLPAKEN